MGFIDNIHRETQRRGLMVERVVNKGNFAQLALTRKNLIRQVMVKFRPLCERLFGMDFKAEGLSSERLQHFLEQVPLKNLNQTGIANLLKNLDHPLTRSLVSDLTYPKTSFFRHPAQYHAFLTAFEKIFASDPKSVRIWVPGCSDGSESYSAAMILKKEGYANGKRPVKVVASDVSAVEIDRAKRGKYVYLDPRLELFSGNDEIIAAHSEYVVSDKHVDVVTPEIYDMIEHRVDNLFASNIQGQFDVISCHWVLYHFTAQAKLRAKEIILAKLKPGGFLVTSEVAFKDDVRLQALPLPSTDPVNKQGYRVYIYRGAV